jgi:hypothetical protein
VKVAASGHRGHGYRHGDVTAGKGASLGRAAGA